MCSTTKFNRFDEDCRFIGRSDDSKHFMRKSKKFGSAKARGCGCHCRQQEDWSASDEEDSKPCCEFSDHRKCKNFLAESSYEKRNEDKYQSKHNKRDKQELWSKSEEKAFKQKCKCYKNTEDDVQVKKNKADKRVISIYTKLSPDDLPPPNKSRPKYTKCKKGSKSQNNSIDLIKICRNSNEGDNGNNSTEEDKAFDSESSFYATRADNYRQILGPTIDETVLVCLDLLTSIAMKINMFHCFSGQCCKTKTNSRRKRTTKKELEQIQSSSGSSDS